jgi:O-antigen ligase
VLAGLALAAIILVANLAVSHRSRLIGVAVLLVPQFYLPGLPISAAVLWTLITCLAGIATRGRPMAGSPLFSIAALFAFAQAVSLLWALPSGLYFGIVSAVFSTVFALWLREVIVLAKDDASLINTIVKWAAPGIAIQSVLCILFRISPGIEDRFLRSEIATITMGRRALALFSDSPANVFDPSKAGGFFANGNQASLFGGVAALLLWVGARRSGDRWLYLVAALSLVGSVATGSKTAPLAAAILGIAILLLPQMLRSVSGSIGLTFVALAVSTLAISEMITRDRSPLFTGASGASYAVRQRLWERAVRLLEDSPWLGVGFGGWEEQIGKIGSVKSLPPHNYLIAAWLNSGLVAAALVAGFIFTAVVFGLRVAGSQRTVRDRRTAVIALGAPGWAFLHGLGDNTGFYGDRASMILVALAFGYMYSMRRSRSHDGDQAQVSDGERRRAPVALRRSPLGGQAVAHLATQPVLLSPVSLTKKELPVPPVVLE